VSSNVSVSIVTDPQTWSHAPCRFDPSAAMMQAKLWGVPATATPSAAQGSGQQQQQRQQPQQQQQGQQQSAIVTPLVSLPLHLRQQLATCLPAMQRNLGVVLH
jgi:hypothetical protein